MLAENGITNIQNKTKQTKTKKKDDCAPCAPAPGELLVCAVAGLGWQALLQTFLIIIRAYKPASSSILACRELLNSDLKAIEFFYQS